MAEERRSGVKKDLAAFDLGSAIVQYASTKDEINGLQKIIDKLNADIKQTMRTRKLDEYTVGDISASITLTERSEFNDLQAIEILRKELTPELFSEVVKTKEYIDEEALENLHYSGKVDAAILAPATTPKEPMVTLRIKKVKTK